MYGTKEQYYQIYRHLNIIAMYYIDIMYIYKYLKKLNTFHKLDTLFLAYNNINSLRQLDQLNILNIQNLYIYENDIIKNELIRLYIAYRLSNIKIFNDKLITNIEKNEDMNILIDYNNIIIQHY